MFFHANQMYPVLAKYTVLISCYTYKVLNASVCMSPHYVTVLVRGYFEPC